MLAVKESCSTPFARAESEGSVVQLRLNSTELASQLTALVTNCGLATRP